MYKVPNGKNGGGKKSFERQRMCICQDLDHSGSFLIDCSSTMGHSLLCCVSHPFFKYTGPFCFRRIEAEVIELAPLKDVFYFSQAVSVQGLVSLLSLCVVCSVGALLHLQLLLVHPWLQMCEDGIKTPPSPEFGIKTPPSPAFGIWVLARFLRWQCFMAELLASFPYFVRSCSTSQPSCQLFRLLKCFLCSQAWPWLSPLLPCPSLRRATAVPLQWRSSPPAALRPVFALCS